MSDIEKIAREVIAASEKATAGPWDWDGMEIDEDGYVCVPECRCLGETLINLADIYENSGNDCLFVQIACNAAPTLAQTVLDLSQQVAVLERAVENITETYGEASAPWVRQAEAELAAEAEKAREL